MDTLTCFTILSYQSGRGYFDTPQPSFLVLAMVMELEEQNIIAINDGCIKIVSSDIPAYLAPCLDALREKDTIVQFLDGLLRGFTYSKLNELVLSAVAHVSESHEGITQKRGKYTISADLKRQAQSSLILALGNGEISAIATAALLYGCRTLQDYMDKDEYKSTVALLKNGFTMDASPLTAYILNNIDLIRGHVMGIVAN